MAAEHARRAGERAPGGEPNEGRARTAGARAGVLLVLAAAALGMLVALAPGARAEEPEIRPMDKLTVGAVDPATAPATIGLESRTFAAVSASLETLPPEAVTPLRSVLGSSLAIELTDVGVAVDDEQFSVAFTGTSVGPVAGLDGVETEVLVLADWRSPSDGTPTFVVSVQTGPRTLGEILGVDAQDSIAAELALSSASFVVGTSAIDFDQDSETEEFQHIAWAANLTPLAVEHFETLYGADGLPTVVPALQTLGSTVNVAGAFPLDGLGDVPQDVLGYDDGAAVVLEGGLDVTLDGLAQFDPTSSGWRLSATLPGLEAPSVELPFLFEPDPSARLTLTIAYGSEDDGDGDPDRAVTVTAATQMTTDLFGQTKEYDVELRIKRAVGGGSGRSVGLSVTVPDVWDQPFGVEFLSVYDAFVDGTFSRDGSSGQTKFEGSLVGHADIAGKPFRLRLSGKVSRQALDAEFELSLDDAIGIDEVLDVLGADTGPLPDVLTGPSFGPAGVHVRVVRTGSGGPGSTTTTAPSSSTTQPTTSTTAPAGGTTKVTVAASGTFAFDLANGQQVSVGGLFTVGSDRNVTAVVRPTGNLSLAALLPPGIAAPFDLDLVDDAAGSAFGFAFSTNDATTMVNSLPRFARTFYRPLLGRAPDDPVDVELPIGRGASVLGAFALPDDVATVVGTLGVQSKVFATGTLPIFSREDPVELSLGLRLRSEQLPDIIDQVTGSIEVDAVLVGAEQRLRMGLKGELRLRLPAGLPPEAADPVNGLGVPVETFEPVAPDHECANGSQPQQVRDLDEYRCYDLVSLDVDAGIEVAAGSVGVDINSALKTPRPGDVYRPFGLEWLGIDDARLRLGVTYDGDLGVRLGLQGDVDIAGTDLFVAGQVKVELMATAPWIKVELEGLRAASGAGMEIADFFAIQHQVATVWAEANGEDPPPALVPDDLDIPNLALRNLEFSFSPKGVQPLCIPQGLTLSGDLYINPSGSEPVGNPACDNGRPVIPDADDECVNRRLDGCVASGRLAVSNGGFAGQFQFSGFELGPVVIDEFVVEAKMTLADSYLIGRGGARIENFTGAGPDPLAGGDFEVRFQPLQFQAFGELNVLGWSALVDTRASLDILSDPEPRFDLHVLLASDETDRIGAPSLETFANDALGGVFLPLQTMAVVADEVLAALEGGDPLGALTEVPGRLEGAGIPVPPELAAFADAYDDFVGDWDHILPHAPGSMFDLVMNGIPEFGFSGVEAPEYDDCIFWVPIEGCVEEVTVCLGLSVSGGCYYVPPFEFDGTSGICDIVFPRSEFPDLRDDDGDCTVEGLIDGLVFPLIEGAMEEVTGIDDLDVRGLISALADADGPLLGLDCAEYTLRVRPTEAFSELTLVGEILGLPLGFRLGFDFFDPASSVPDLVGDLVDQILDPGSVTCSGYDEDLFGPGPLPDEPRLTIDAPDIVDEGEEFTLTGSFGQPVDAARSVEVQWGDGTVETVEVATGETDFEAGHAYTDDDPTATSADVTQIVATDLSPGGRTDAEPVTVRNVAPTVTGMTLTTGPIVEGSSESFLVTFSDPGTADTHWLSIDWGDGTRSQHTLTDDAREATVTHVFADDDPTGTPADIKDVTVSVLDDDTGAGSGVFPFTVENGAPADVEVSLTSGADDDGSVAEGAPLGLHVAWTDPGLADTHIVSIDWGAGDELIELAPLAGARELTVEHVFGDNGEFTVGVVVTDDDTGSASAALPVTVRNVDPSVELDRAPTFAAPGGDTFMGRIDAPLEVAAGATDPGSDDLTFMWGWGDDHVDVHTDRVNPPDDDPLPSPTLQPRVLLDERSHTYEQPCLYRLTLGVEDDDGGTAGDEAPVVVVGDADQWRSHGWWGEEYRHFDRPGDTGQIDDQSLLCYLEVAAHMSTVFEEAVALATPADAAAVLHAGDGSDGQRALRLGQLDQALLTAWLNLANGATGTDPTGFVVEDFAEIVRAAEAVRLDPDATTRDLFDAQMAVEAAVRDFS